MSTNVGKSKLAVSKSCDELKHPKSKFTIQCRDVFILSVSFAFTIAVACFVLFYIDNNHRMTATGIEAMVEKILDTRAAKLEAAKVPRDFERKRGYLDERHDDDNGRSKRAVYDYRHQTNEAPIVEFFNPRLRPELEKNDTEIMKKTGWKGAAPKGDSWVWLTSYSRIPFEAIEGFCKKTKEYCPPGPTGSPGVPGLKGIKGDLGPVGPKGESIRGEKGRAGPRGARGEHGFRGLDGRDGVPGEPGLDGIPGRAGTDGKDGRDGIDGRKGDKGLDGKDGTPGSIGLSGPRGPRGQTGLTGPVGKPGVPGKDGQHGAPATCVYCLKKENETSPYDYWLPPQIPISSSLLDKPRPIIVHEGDNLRLQCAATGFPPPTIVWEREDGRAIDWGKWKDNSKVGQSVNITKINRVHMGNYICIADNGIPPVAKYKFQVEVHFKPIVRIRHKWDQAISADFGATVTFKCESEAFPEPILYWERADAVVIANDSSKYRIYSQTVDTYIFNSSLTIHHVNQNDYGEYHCVSKNNIGLERIPFRLGTKGQYVRPILDGDKPLVSGETPAVLSYEEVCPPQSDCPFCPAPKDLKCKDASLSLKDLTGGRELEVITAGNTTYEELENRTQDCELNMVGKPVFHNYLNMEHGAWLRDPIQKDNLTIEKIWLTKENEPTNLYEYKNRNDYRKDKPSRIQPFKLPCPFKGNAHIVYNSNFYYYCADGSKIIRFDLKTERAAITRVLEEVNNTKTLYTTQYNVVDFNADDNGLWIIHAAPESNHTIVSKINETNLETINSFDISIHHHQVGEMFIVCGVLYAVDSATARETKIRFALDLYSKKLIEVDTPFTNPFNGTTTLGYNHNTKELYTWNLGNQLTYPVKIISMGSNQTAEEPFDKILHTVGHSAFRHHN